MPSTSELATRLVQALAPCLDDDEYRLFCFALGTESNQRMIAAMLAIAHQKRCALPADLVADLDSWRRQSRNCRTRPVSSRRTGTARAGS